jgi:transposase
VEGGGLDRPDDRGVVVVFNREGLSWPLLVGSIFIAARSRSSTWIPRAGEVSRGRVAPADRGHLRAWLRRLEGQEAAFAVEACTGWRFVVEELERAGAQAHLAEPAETAALRGPKRRAKTDRADARHLRELLMAARLPESWIPPAHVSDARTEIRLYKALVDERTGWLQRVHAILFQLGAPAVPGLARASGRGRLDLAALPPAARSAVEVALRSVDRVNDELDTLRPELARLSRAQSGCRALQAHYGIGPLTSVAIWAELGDCGRFSSSSDAVRHSGLDVTVHSSDRRRARGHLARQGPGVLRWHRGLLPQCDCCHPTRWPALEE